VADRLFEEPRLAQIYDALDADRSDLDVYVALVEELGARSVLDVGCGTGTFACLLAQRGIDVVGLDPAGASLAVARSKPGAGKVTWVHGDTSALPPLHVDLTVMTGNVAQVFTDDDEWLTTLRRVCSAVTADGHVVFETRDPESSAWQEWNETQSRRTVEICGVGAIESWVELTAVNGSLVSFRWTYVFESDGAVLTSDSTLRFRTHDEIAQSMRDVGITLVEVRDAPDRPGRELVFIGRRGRS
jgi:ubiquinone/menaquinone biosynthesis C-methylase UbiE